jgi:putative membrane protein
LQKPEIYKMKKLSYVIMLAFAVYILQGCNNARKSANQNEDSLHAPVALRAPDTGGPHSAPQTPDTARKPYVAPKPVIIKVNSADAKFAVDAAGDNLSEVALSVIALQITKDQNIKTIADTVIIGHNKINDQLTAIAKSKNVTLPSFISPEVEKNREALAKKSGKDFDKAYINALVSGHQKALKLYKNAAESCTDADLKAFAAKTVPVIQLQLDAISKIHTAM